MKVEIVNHPQYVITLSDDEVKTLQTVSDHGAKEKALHLVRDIYGSIITKSMESAVRDYENIENVH